jgi:hypothetical protein
MNLATTSLLTRDRGDVVPGNTGTVPPNRAVIAPADPEGTTEGIEEDTDTEGLYNTPLDSSGLGKQPVGTGFMLLGAAAVVGFFLMRNKKGTRRRKTTRKARRK